MKNKIITLFAMSFVLSMSVSVWAHEHKEGERTSRSKKKRGKRKPLQAALDACQSLNVGDSCSFTGRGDRAVAGTCFTPKESKPLACRPERKNKK